jgi:hypothetical protein
MKSDWRAECPVLVVEAQTLGAIAVIRSLGRGGYPVHSCSRSADALGFKSRYSSSSTVCPAYQDPAFPDWLREYIRENKIRTIIPSEGFLLAIRREFHEFSSLLPYSPNESIAYSGLSKADQVSRLTCGPLASRTADHMPPFLVVDEPSDLPSAEALRRLGFPVFIKVDGCYARDQGEGHVYKAESVEEANTRLAEIASRYKKILVEGHVPGRGVGAFFLRWQNRTRAEFMHMRLHEVPHTGGVSSYRKSWWHDGVRADALAKLEALEWQGVAMLEYRWDEARDEFYFMEMNGRFWGSLHLALRAGVDFPLLLVDLFLGGEVARPQPRHNARCRYTFPSEVLFLRSRWKDPNLGWLAKFRSLLEFFYLGVNPRVGSDLCYPGDRRLYWRELFRFLKSHLRYLVRGG